MNPLKNFNKFTEQWFSKTLGAPTKVQELAWPAIMKGQNTLVSAPTGTGKTLSAFLVFIDQLKEEAREGTLKNELRLIYISPLKSLAGDIRENLRRPLNGISIEELKATRHKGVSPKSETIKCAGATRHKEVSPKSETIKCAEATQIGRAHV